MKAYEFTKQEPMISETEEEYLPVNLCALYDYTDDPPPGLFDDEGCFAGNPFSETILRKIGNTWYSIRTECDGAEPLAEKVKRLIFNDPLSRVTGNSRKAAVQG